MVRSSEPSGLVLTCARVVGLGRPTSKPWRCPGERVSRPPSDLGQHRDLDDLRLPLRGRLRVSTGGGGWQPSERAGAQLRVMLRAAGAAARASQSSLRRAFLHPRHYDAWLAGWLARGGAAGGYGGL